MLPKVTVDAYAGMRVRNPPSNCHAGCEFMRPNEVPQRDTDQAEDRQRHLLGAVDLPHPMPEVLPLQRVLTDELLPQDAVDQPARLVTAVVADMVDRIVAGELPVGSALPTEPVLCEIFSVSRAVIREAVKSLEGMQLVRAQQGLGTRVREAVDWDLLNPVVLAASVRHDAERSILEDLVSVWRALESQMTGQASRAATDSQLGHIEAASARY